MSSVGSMGSARLLLALLLLAAVGGCAGTPLTQRSLPPPPAPADLDSLAYGRAAVGVKAAVAPSNEGKLAQAASSMSKSAAGAFAQAQPEFPNVDEPYRLDSGDRLRVVVFGQDGLINSYL